MGIFVMSSERSGSNLLQSLIGSALGLIALPPLHLSKYLGELSGLYFPCSTRDAHPDLLAVAQKGALPWPGLAYIRNERPDGRTTENFWNSLLSFYDWTASAVGSTGWVAKENQIFNYALDIWATDPTTKFVYLVRDGRDVTLSLKRLTQGRMSVRDAARLWLREQIAAMRIEAVLSSHSAVMRLKYEDLVSNPVATMNRIANFAEVPLRNPGALQERVNGDRAVVMNAWSGLSKPLFPDRASAWEEEMSLRQRSLFDSVSYSQIPIGSALELLGYPRTSVNAPHFGWFTAKSAVWETAVSRSLKALDRVKRREKRPWLQSVADVKTSIAQSSK